MSDVLLKRAVALEGKIEDALILTAPLNQDNPIVAQLVSIFREQQEQISGEVAWLRSVLGCEPTEEARSLLAEEAGKLAQVESALDVQLQGLRRLTAQGDGPNVVVLSNREPD